MPLSKWIESMNSWATASRSGVTAAATAPRAHVATFPGSEHLAKTRREPGQILAPGHAGRFHDPIRARFSATERLALEWPPGALIGNGFGPRFGPQSLEYGQVGDAGSALPGGERFFCRARYSVGLAGRWRVLSLICSSCGSAYEPVSESGLLLFAEPHDEQIKDGALISPRGPEK